MIKPKLKQNLEHRIKFVSGTHKYYKADNEYISATTLKKKFVPAFDEKYWALYTAIREYLNIEKEDFSKVLKNRYGFYSRNKDISQLETIAQIISPSIIPSVPDVLNRWNEYKEFRGGLGTRFHNRKEEQSYQEGYAVIGDIKAETKTYYSYNISTLPDGFYSELLVYLDYDFDAAGNMYNAFVAGQVDKCIITTDRDGTRWVDIDDYKTCATIKTDTYDKLLYPFDQYHHNDVNEFAIQLNIYGYIMQQWGYRIRSLRFTHCMIDPETEELIAEKVYHLPVFPELIQKAILHHRLKH